MKLINGKFILVMAIILSLTAWCISYSSNYVLTYNDAASHLNIARRIIDSYTPGFAQIGTVWLPLPHILMFLFAWNDFLWKTALAGSIVSMSAYVLSVVFTYKTILLLSQKRLGALIGSLIVALNPNLLYLQTTPMTETLLIATFVMSAYFLAKYVKTKDMLNLILTGVFVMFSTLIRYDGWFLFITLALAIPFTSLIARNGKKAEGEFLIFTLIGGLGIVLWVVWNWAIFHDPLYFITGPYSAYAQQQILKSAGQLPTAGNLREAGFYYIASAIENNGILLIAAAAFCLILIPFLIKNKKIMIVILAVLSPLIFNILALFAGQSAMNVPEAPHNPGLFNIRYGIMVLPIIAIVLGLVTNYVKYSWGIILGILFSQLILFYQAGIPVTLADGIDGLNNTYYTIEASKWLSDNYHGGLILTSLASNDAFVARAHLNMRNYIQEGNGIYWESALKNPSKSIKYVAALTYPPDRVWQKLSNNEDFLKNYTEVHSYKEFRIYELK